MSLFFESLLYLVMTPVLLLVTILAILILISPVVYVVNYWYEKYLVGAFYKKFGADKKVLFVFNNNYKWNEYLKYELFPRIESKTVYLDISEAYENKNDLRVKIFEHFKSKEEYCPLALVINDRNKFKQFHFYRPLLKNYRGNNAKLVKLERQFLKSIGSADSPVNSGVTQ